MAAGAGMASGIAAGEAAGAGLAEAEAAGCCACSVANARHVKHAATARLVILRNGFVIFVFTIIAILGVGLLPFLTPQFWVTDVIVQDLSSGQDAP